MSEDKEPQHDCLRLVAWNMGHRTREVAIPSAFYRAIQLLRPDVLILNEFKDGASRRELRERLRSFGLGDVLVSTDVPGCNQVLIASRSQLQFGDVPAPQSPDQHAFTNFLHVRHLASGLEIVGLRAPAYDTVSKVDSYWRAMATTLKAFAGRRVVIAGDFNLEPARARSGAYSLFSDLLRDGWNLPQPFGEWSYVAGTRIDHVLAEPTVHVARCEYVTEIGGVVLASRDRARRVSDHAALLVSVSLGSPGTSERPLDIEHPSQRILTSTPRE